MDKARRKRFRATCVGTNVPQTCSGGRGGCAAPHIVCWQIRGLAGALFVFMLDLANSALQMGLVEVAGRSRCFARSYTTVVH